MRKNIFIQNHFFLKEKPLRDHNIFPSFCGAAYYDIHIYNGTLIGIIFKMWIMWYYLVLRTLYYKKIKKKGNVPHFSQMLSTFKKGLK